MCLSVQALAILCSVPASRLDSVAVVSALRQLRAQGRSLQPRAMKLRQPELWMAIEQLFPAYEQALAAAGIPARSLTHTAFVRWDRELIVQRLRQLAAQGKDLNTGAIQKYEPRLAGAIFRYFGKHDAALTAAGIDPVSVRRARWWTKQEVLDELLQRRRKGEDLSHDHMNRHAAPLFGAMNRYFGSYAKALRAAGIDPEQVKKPWPVVWPTDRILWEIQRYYARWWEKHHRTEPPRPRLNGANPLLAGAARNRFGSIGAALKAAGIDDPTYKPHRQWTADKVLRSLRDMHRQGTALSYKAIHSTDPQLHHAAERYFGSLRDAVKATGLPYVQHPRSDRKELRHWTEDLVLQSLKDLHAQGCDLRHRTMNQKHQPLFWAAVCLFGSYANAVRMAGINYWSMSQAQLARQRKGQAGRFG